MWYKANTGIQTQYNEALQQVRVTDRSFGAQDVFNLQFPHYNKPLAGMNTREAGA